MVNYLSFLSVADLQGNSLKLDAIERSQSSASLELVLELNECKVLRGQSYIPAL